MALSEEQIAVLARCIVDGSYIFDLRMICGGRAYYATYSHCTTVKPRSHREVREPSLINVLLLTEYLRILGLGFTAIAEEKHYRFWLQRRGWAVVSKAFAKEKMKQWLYARECVANAHDTYTDIRIAHPRATGHRTSHKRDELRARDNEQCVICGSTSSKGAKLTLHHVRAFSLGGETTEQNLVACCEPCNALIGTGASQEAFDHLGDYNLDISLVQTAVVSETWKAVVVLSKNRLYSMCAC
jgi:5-methylcytosine-specific restriction endonuclease McrA